MTTDLREKTVAELREMYLSPLSDKGEWEIFDELARRLEEAQQRNAAHDAEVAAKALEEFRRETTPFRNNEEIIILLDKKATEYRDNAGRKI